MSEPGQVGCYRGVRYVRRRICDMLAVPTRARWWWTLDADGRPTGDHYRTLTELRAAVDSQSKRQPTT